VKSLSLWAACALALAGNATAAVTPIGEFTGDAFENFENIGPPNQYPGGMAVFGGAAMFNDLLTNAPWITTSLTGPNGTVFPYDGFFMGLAPTGWSVFDFDTPVTRFGGFLAAAFTSDPGNVSFFDEKGDLLETIAISLPTTTWTWYGWESTEGISRIELRAGLNPGTTLVLDNMQMSFVPAPPAALALAAMGLWTPRRRRGRH